MSTAIRVVLTVLLAWGFFTFIYLAAGWVTPRLNAMPGYWAMMTMTGGTLVLAAVTVTLLALIWTAGR